VLVCGPQKIFFSVVAAGFFVIYLFLLSYNDKIFY